jgi:pilus assembly protein CpaB
LSRRTRIGILVAVIGIALAIFGIVFLTRMVRNSLSPLPAPTLPAPLAERVVVSSRYVSIGTVLRASDLRMVDAPVEMIPPGALTDIEAALGKYVKTDLVQGEMVLSHHLADPTNISGDVGYTINESQVLMAFPAADLMSTLGILKRGDVIDIFVTMDQEVRIIPEDEQQLAVTTENGNEETRIEFLTFDAFQRIDITAMVVDVIEQEQNNTPQLNPAGTPQPQPTPSPAQTRIRAYLFALQPQDALVLKHLNDTGATFDFVLRSPTSTQLFDVNPVTSDFLIDKFELELPE